MSVCDECRNDFDDMSRLVESLPDDMKTSDCVLNAKMLLVALAYQKAEKENAKLRELVRDYEHCSVHADCGRCEYDGTTSTHCPLSPCFPDIDELRELGVEVNDG